MRGFLLYTNMRFDKIIYDVRESLNFNSDDVNITDEYIAYLISVYRAELLKHELNSQQRTVSPINIQSFCLEMEEVSSFDCGIDVGCETILRSKQQLPSLIKTHIGNSLTMVRPIDRKARSFTLIEEARLSYLPNSKFTKSIYYFIGSDSHMYLVSKSDTFKLIKCINVSGIFADPLELQDYKNCCNCDNSEDNNCFDIYESDYPISADQIPMIVTLIGQRLVTKLQIPNDNVNDGSGNF